MFFSPLYLPVTRPWEGPNSRTVFFSGFHWCST
uniref:Uncharacterized protein n=1 Tax=Anguilla anguilla TaxID=7936 RepID=A0A0E9RJG0_ANGAN